VTTGKKELPHTHVGHEHEENGSRVLTKREIAMVERVKKMWYNGKYGAVV